MVRAREGPTAVADVYLEVGVYIFLNHNFFEACMLWKGSDQHRGWFQSSLLTAVSDQSASSDTVLAPYKVLWFVLAATTVTSCAFRPSSHMALLLTKMVGKCRSLLAMALIRMM